MHGDRNVGVKDDSRGDGINVGEDRSNGNMKCNSFDKRVGIESRKHEKGDHGGVSCLV